MPRLIPLIALPFLELFILIELGSVLGGTTVLLYCLATAIAGVWLIQRQANALADLAQRTREAMIAGRTPTPVSLEPHAIGALAGVLLAIPGVITDAFALGLGLMALKRQLDRRPPRRRPRRKAPPPEATDVEIIPPGRIESPFRRPPPDVIDIP